MATAEWEDTNDSVVVANDTVPQVGQVLNLFVKKEFILGLVLLCERDEGGVYVLVPISDAAGPFASQFQCPPFKKWCEVSDQYFWRPECMFLYNSLISPTLRHRMIGSGCTKMLFRLHQEAFEAAVTNEVKWIMTSCAERIAMGESKYSFDHKMQYIKSVTGEAIPMLQKALQTSLDDIRDNMTATVEIRDLQIAANNLVRIFVQFKGGDQR